MQVGPYRTLSCCIAPFCVRRVCCWCLWLCCAAPGLCSIVCCHCHYTVGPYACCICTLQELVLLCQKSGPCTPCHLCSCSHASLFLPSPLACVLAVCSCLCVYACVMPVSGPDGFLVRRRGHHVAFKAHMQFATPVVVHRRALVLGVSYMNFRVLGLHSHVTCSAGLFACSTAVAKGPY